MKSSSSGPFVLSLFMFVAVMDACFSLCFKKFTYTKKFNIQILLVVIRVFKVNYIRAVLQPETTCHLLYKT